MIGFDEIDNSRKKIFAKNLLEFCEDNPNVRIVITCRRNFYEVQGENYKGTLKGFEEYILTNISDSDVRDSLLNNNINETKFYQEINDKKLNFLVYNPFYLNKIIEFFIADGKLPNRNILLDKIIEKSFNLDKNKYETNSYKLRDLLEKIALSLELLGRNYLKEKEYYELINNINDIEILQCSSIWQKEDNQIWKFKHNNFQEYLASQKLRQYSINEIKQMVCYKNVDNKIKPSWVNTLTFLANSEKNNELIDWILKCMPEFFIQIEDGILDFNTKQKMFWNVFEEFKRKKVWIEYNIYNSRQLMLNKEDIERLINEIKENYHYTSVGNSLHILKNVKNLFGLDNKLKNILNNLLSNDNYTQYNKSIAIELLGERKLININEFNEIVKMNEKNESSNLRKSYFYCCNTMEIVDETIDFILKRYEIEVFGIKATWYENESEDIYFWDEHKEYEETFSKIKNKETIKKVIDYIESKKINERENDFEILSNLIKSILRIYKKNSEFLDICIELYFYYEKNYHYKCMNYIINTIQEKKLILEFFKHYMKNNSNKSFIELGKMINDECLNYYYQEYKKGEFTDEDTKYILRFSNKRLANYNELKQIYEDKTGDNIQENIIIDYDKIKNESIYYFINKLFEKEKFINFINSFKKEFQDKYKCKEILVKDLLEYKHRALTNENNKYYYLCNFLIKHFKDNEMINTHKIQTYNWDYVILGELYEIWNNEKIDMKLSKSQVDIVKKICFNLLPQVNFRSSISYSSKNTFSVNWLSIYLFFFRYKLDFKYQENILLDMLEFDWQIDGNYIGIEYIIKNVDHLKIRKRIIENLNKKDIRSQIFINHVKYCIENNINQCIEAVGKYLIKKSIFPEERKISTEYLLQYTKTEDFINKYIDNNKISFQKEILGYISDSKKKTIYNWLLKRNRECRKIEDKMFFAQQLIYIGKKEGIEFYYNWAKKNMHSYENRVMYKDINDAVSLINQISQIDILIDFLELTLNIKFKDNRFNSLYRSLYVAIKNIGSQNDSNFILTRHKLLYLFNKRKEYVDIGKIQYLIHEMEYSYIGNLQNTENIKSIKKFLEIS